MPAAAERTAGDPPGNLTALYETADACWHPDACFNAANETGLLEAPFPRRCPCTLTGCAMPASGRGDPEAPATGRRVRGADGPPPIRHARGIPGHHPQPNTPWTSRRPTPQLARSALGTIHP
jgi:hypothetical protein